MQEIQIKCFKIAIVKFFVNYQIKKRIKKYETPLFA